MKKLGIIIVSLALVFGFTQCKKNVETIANSASEGVFITLTVENGSRHEVNPSTGEVSFADGDVVYVGHNGAYVGTLTYGSGNFSGTITPGETSDYLYFYFLGGLETTPNTLSAANQSYTINISNQREKLPVLSLGKSNVRYSSEVTTYTSELLNQCALVKFSLTEETPSYLNVNGMLVEAAINFANHSITPTETTGTIQLRTQNQTERWAIMLPQAAVTGATATIGDDSYTVDIPAITANGYITSGIVIDNTPAPVEYLFSVSATKQVCFSPGNLQYNPSMGIWRFAEHQYDICTPVSGLIYLISNDGYIYEPVSESDYYQHIENNDVEDAYTTYDASSQYTSTYNGWIDLFCWGRWGSIGNPYDTDEGLTYSWNSDFSGTLDGHNDWYTMTGTNSGEWNYLFNGRTGASSKWGYATVCNIHGIILLPDDGFVDPNTNNGSGAFVPSTTTGYDANIYSGSDWNAMESAGAVFLPSAGRRFETEARNAMDAGFYWSSTADSKGDGPSAWGPHFESDKCYEDTQGCCRGCAVRLVREVVSSSK